MCYPCVEQVVHYIPTQQLPSLMQRDGEAQMRTGRFRNTLFARDSPDQCVFLSLFGSSLNTIHLNLGIVVLFVLTGASDLVYSRLYTQRTERSLESGHAFDMATSYMNEDSEC